MSSKLELGDRVKDVVSGFSGIATARTSYLNGCDRIIVEPEELENGKIIESRYFDEMQLKVVKKGVLKSFKALEEKSEKGGPKDTASPTRTYNENHRR